jgi:hypothetical protein
MKGLLSEVIGGPPKKLRDFVSETQELNTVPMRSYQPKPNWKVGPAYGVE